MKSGDVSRESSENVESDQIANTDETSNRDANTRRVSFPTHDDDLVTGYSEPDDPLRLAKNVNKDVLLQSYTRACNQYNTAPLKCVLDQIEERNFNSVRSGTLDLSNEMLSYYCVESLEEILKRAQFNYISLSECSMSTDLAITLFEMFEYYESTLCLHLSRNFDIQTRGWQACARYLKKSTALEELIISDIWMDGNLVQSLFKQLQTNRFLQILKLENCNINGISLRHLVNSLSSNVTLKELYLSDNSLGVAETIILGDLLKQNHTLQLLDLSNNHIQNEGLDRIVKALLYECDKISAIEVLIVWNNYLDTSSAQSISQLLSEYKGRLNILNVGCNLLYDSFMQSIAPALMKHEYLTRLGLQLTGITCDSAESLAAIIQNNKVIERIDLRENEIYVPGIRTISKSLDHNYSCTQIDLNDENIVCGENRESYRAYVKAIKEKCLRNEMRQPEEEVPAPQTEAKPATSRKISLTCQSLSRSRVSPAFPPLLSEPKKVSGRLRSPAPSPIPSPVSTSSPDSLISKPSRFSVVRVSETNSLGSTPRTTSTSGFSRFTVTVVEAPKTKSVASNKNTVTIGFDCTTTIANTTTSTSSSTEHSDKWAVENQENSSLAMNIRYTNTNKEDEPSVVSDKNVVQEKPATSLQKLLSLFQNPPNLFSQQTDNVIKPIYDSLKCFQFTNTITANVSSDSSNGDLNSQTMENVSPKRMKQMVIGDDKCVLNQSALDNSNTELDCDSVTVSKVQSEVEALKLSSSRASSTESYSGSATSTLDDSCTTNDSDSSSEQPLSLPTPAATDLTNNNIWKADSDVTVDDQESPFN